MEKRKKKKGIRWFHFLLEVLLLALLAALLFFAYKITRIRTKGLDEEKLVKNESIPANELNLMDDYRNIALFGVDSREGNLESGTNSDTIMICSINEKTGDIRLVSVYRDTYLDIGDGSYQKCNAAYAAGGAQQAVSMLNKNLDLNITDYVTVNFEALVDLIDLIGGVDITLSEGEVGYLNGYLVEARQVLGRECEDVSGPGLQHLNGMQALAFCRIRYIGLDFERTERQREVLEQVLAKMRECDVLTVNQAVDLLLPEVATSLSMPDILGLVAKAGNYQLGETTGFPFDLAMADISAGDCVVPVDLAANVSQLHEFLFDSIGYVPSFTVQQISDTIRAETGI